MGVLAAPSVGQWTNRDDLRTGKRTKYERVIYGLSFQPAVDPYLCGILLQRGIWHDSDKIKGSEQTPVGAEVLRLMGDLPRPSSVRIFPVPVCLDPVRPEHIQGKADRIERGL